MNIFVIKYIGEKSASSDTFQLVIANLWEIEAFLVRYFSEDSSCVLRNGQNIVRKCVNLPRFAVIELENVIFLDVIIIDKELSGYVDRNIFCALILFVFV